MLLGSVGTNDEDGLCLLGNIVHRIGHCSRTEGSSQTGHSAGVSETRAVVYVVCSDHLAREFVHQIIFFIGALG